MKKLFIYLAVICLVGIMTALLMGCQKQQAMTGEVEEIASETAMDEERRESVQTEKATDDDSAKEEKNNKTAAVDVNEEKKTESNLIGRTDSSNMLTRASISTENIDIGKSNTSTSDKSIDSRINQDNYQGQREDGVQYYGDPTKCDHNWVETTTTIHHDEVGHNEDHGHYEEQVVDGGFYRRTYREASVCLVCGAILSDMSTTDAHDHMSTHLRKGEGGNTGVRMVVDTEEWVPEITENVWIPNNVWVVDTPAYDEIKVLYTSCTKCGLTVMK